MLTTKRISNGEFEVYWNGQKTSFEIINGSLGLSGKDTPNVYGIIQPNKPVKWIGTLQACKKVLSLTFQK